MAFKVGQKVVAIRNDSVHDDWRNEPLVIGKVYTISAVDERRFNGAYSIAYHVAEAACHPKDFWSHSHFRPLQETGMSILKAILANPHKQLETVE